MYVSNYVLLLSSHRKCKSLTLCIFFALLQSEVTKFAGKFYDEYFDSFACIIVLQTCKDLNARYFFWLIFNFSLHGSKD